MAPGNTSAGFLIRVFMVMSLLVSMAPPRNQKSSAPSADGELGPLSHSGFWVGHIG